VKSLISNDDMLNDDYHMTLSQTDCIKIPNESKSNTEMKWKTKHIKTKQNLTKYFIKYSQKQIPKQQQQQQQNRQNYI